MAAVDEDGSQSENKSEDVAKQQRSKQFSVMQQEVENQLMRQNASYSERVNAILRGWDFVAGSSGSSSSSIINFGEFLYRWTLQLVLQGEWPSLQRIVKTRLTTSLHRCSGLPLLGSVTKTLLPLVSNPWDGPELKLVLDNETVNHEQGAAYLSTEAWEVARVRVDCLLEERLQQFAYKLLAVCHTHLNDSDSTLPECPEEDREHFTDLYLVLLYKFDRNTFLDKMKQTPEEEGVAFVQRLLHRPDDKSRVWKHRLKIGDIASKIFLATTISKHYSDVFWHVFSEWCSVQLKIGVSEELLEEMVRKYISLAHSQKHLYTMSSVLHFKCKGRQQSLVIELLIRGLTLDMNDIETLKAEDSADQPLKIAELERCMAMGFLELAAVFEEHPVVARECVLTAFSLHPTPDKLERLQHYAVLESCASPLKSSNVNSLSVQEGITDQLDKVQNCQLVEKAEGGVAGQANQPVATQSTDEQMQVHDSTVPMSPIPSCVQQPSNEPASQISPGNLPSERLSSCIGNDAETVRNERLFSETDTVVDSTRTHIGRAHSVHSCIKEPSVDHIVVDTGQPPTFDEGNMKCGSQVFQENSFGFSDKSEQNNCLNSLSSMLAVDEEKPFSRSENENSSRRDSTQESLLPEENSEESSFNHSLIPATSMLSSSCQLLMTPGEMFDSEKLGLRKELCEDLAVVLSSPRWQGLSWMLGWRYLQPLCENYVVNSEATKNLTKELKYIDLDYSQFRHLPSVEINEFTGIEKGYEQFIYDVDDADEKQPLMDVEKSQTSQRTESTNIKNERNRSLKAYYYDSDSDYDSSGFQRLKIIDSGSDGEAVGVRKRGRSVKLGKPKGRRKDEDWVGIVDGKRVRAGSSSSSSCTSRRKRMRTINSCIDSVLARHIHVREDSASTNQSSTNDSSVDDTTEDSDVPDIRTIINNEQYECSNYTRGASLSISGFNKNVRGSKPRPMKSNQMRNNLRFFRKPPFLPQQHVLRLPYTPSQRCITEAMSPKFRFNVNSKCSLSSVSYGNQLRPRFTQLIEPLPRLPNTGAKSCVNSVSVKTEPVDPADEAARSSPEIIDVTPPDLQVNKHRPMTLMSLNNKLKSSVTLKQLPNSLPYRRITALQDQQRLKLMKARQLMLQNQQIARKNMTPVPHVKQYPVGRGVTVTVPITTNAKTVTTTSATQVVSRAPNSRQQEAPEDVRLGCTEASAPLNVPSTSSSSVEDRVSHAVMAQRNGPYRYAGSYYSTGAGGNNQACFYRTRDGRVIPLLNNSLFSSGVPKLPTSMGAQHQFSHRNNVDGSNKSYSNRSFTNNAMSRRLKEEENSALLAQIRSSGTTVIRKQVPLDPVFDKRKEDRYDIGGHNGRQPLVSAQKNVLNRLMSHDNFSSLNSAIRPPIRAMPVSHKPPNILLEKSGSSLHRELPKGTTVVRKNRLDAGGPGPSGINNGGSLRVQGQVSGAAVLGSNVAVASSAAKLGRSHASGSQIIPQSAVGSPTVSVISSCGQQARAPSVAASAALHSVTLPAASYVVTNHSNVSISSSTGNMVHSSVMDDSRDGIVLSHGIGNQVFTHSANREGYNNRSPVRSIATNRRVVENSYRLTDSSLADIENSSSVAAVTEPGNFLAVDGRNINVSSNVTSAPLGHATMDGGAPNDAISTLGGASGVAESLTLSVTASTVATSPRDETLMSSKGIASTSELPLQQPAVAVRLPSGIIGGGLLGRVLAASGQSGVRLLGGSCITSTGCVAPSAETIVGSSIAAGDVITTASAAKCVASVLPSVSSSGSDASPSVTAPSMLETLLRESSVKRLTSSPASSASSNAGIVFSDLAPSAARSNHAALLPKCTVITSGGHQNRLLSSSGFSGTSLLRSGLSARDTAILNSTNLESSAIEAVDTSDSNFGSSSLIVSNSSASGTIISSGPESGSLVLNAANALANNSVILTSGGAVSSGGVLLGTATSSTCATSSDSCGLQQVLVPAQLVQLQTNDGSTGLGLVHSTSLDIRLPAGTRVIRSNGSTLGGSVVTTLVSGVPLSYSNNAIITTNSPLSTGVVTTASNASARQLGVLQNLKILHNRQLVRTVVMPSSVALQGISSSQGTQFVAIASGGGSAAASGSGQSETGLLKTSGASGQFKSQPRSMGGPCGLVIRTVRPSGQQAIDSTIIQEKGGEQTLPVSRERIPQLQIRTRTAGDEGLAGIINKHYLKSVGQLNSSSTSVQSVGTQTQTTAVKNTAGQLVSQVVMNNMTGTATVSSLPTTAVLSVASSNTTQNATLSSLPLTSSNAVSSETLEQLREFESVFEKVSNKSTKEDDDVVSKVEEFPVVTTAAVVTNPSNSDESIIAAQLLNMANDTSVRTTQSYVYSLPSVSSPSQGTFLTIPSSTQPGTYILVNNSSLVAASGTASALPQVVAQSPQVVVTAVAQPPPVASPALSTSSSHSSIPSSPSSTPTATKKKPPTSKIKAVSQTSGIVVITSTTTSTSTTISTSSTINVVTTTKTPSPPKASSKPQMAKPQVEDNDEIRARIKVILDNYKLQLAETPQQQPAPRNRKNCPPSRTDAKASSKKKTSSSSGKKLDGSATSSPIASETGASASPSPSVTPATPTSGLVSEQGGVELGSSTSCVLQSAVGLSNSGSADTESVAVVVKNDVVANVKSDASVLSGALGAIQTAGQTTIAPGSRILQFIRAGSKVTAITTRQPLYKGKAAVGSQSGPPPNVTIQGRINVSDFMDSHLASLLSGNPQATVISKKLADGGTVQQVLLQTQSGQLIPASQITTGGQSAVIASNTATGGAQVIQTIGGAQHTVVQPGTGTLVQIPSGQPVGIHTATGQVVHLSSGSSAILPSGTQVQLQVAPASGASGQVQTILQGGAAIVQATATRAHLVPQSGQQIVVHHSSAGGSASVIKQALQSQKTLTSAGGNDCAAVISINAGTSNDMDFSSNSTKISPDTSDTEDSTASLPSFFTLTKSLSSESNSVSKKSVVRDVADGSGTVYTMETGIVGDPSTLGSKAVLNCAVQAAVSSKQQPLRIAATSGRTRDTTVGSQLSAAEEDPAAAVSVLTKRLLSTGLPDDRPSSGNVQQEQSILSHHGLPQQQRSTLVVTSSGSGSTSLMLHSVESSPNPELQTQLHSSSSACASPVTSHDLSFAPLSPALYNSAQSGTSCTAVSAGESVVGGNSGLIQSPSSDVYLDSAGAGMGLDPMPMVAGMEGRVHSPALSDLVAAGNLIPWSPRSADSMMAQSPSIHDALTSNMGLDVPHSSDTLCDSSTPFPGLFSIEGDGASVSSSASEDLTFQHDPQASHITTQALACTASPMMSDVNGEPSISDTLHSLTSSTIHSMASQDQTITSSKSESASSSGGRKVPLRSQCLVEQPESTGLTGGCSQTPWRFENIGIPSVHCSPHRAVNSNTCLIINNEVNQAVDIASAVVEAVEVPDLKKESSTNDELSEDLSSRKSHRQRNCGTATCSKAFISKKEDSCNSSAATFVDDDEKTKIKNYSRLAVLQVKQEDKDCKEESIDDDAKTDIKTDLFESKLELGLKQESEEKQQSYGRGRRIAARKKTSDEISTNLEEFHADFKRRKEESSLLFEDQCSTFERSVDGVNSGTKTSSAVFDSNSSASFETNSQSSVTDIPASALKKRRTTTALISSPPTVKSTAPGSYLTSLNIVPSTNPTIVSPSALSASGVTTRRASNRDHTKKQRCSCCVGGTTHNSSVTTSTTTSTATTSSSERTVPTSPAIMLHTDSSPTSAAEAVATTLCASSCITVLTTIPGRRIVSTCSSQILPSGVRRITSQGSYGAASVTGSCAASGSANRRTSTRTSKACDAERGSDRRK